MNAEDFAVILLIGRQDSESDEVDEDDEKECEGRARTCASRLGLGQNGSVGAAGGKAQADSISNRSGPGASGYRV